MDLLTQDSVTVSYYNNFRIVDVVFMGMVRYTHRYMQIPLISGEPLRKLSVKKMIL